MPFKIRTKLTVAFVGIILFIISVVGVIAWYNQKALFSSLHKVEYAYTEREYVSDIRIAVEKTVMAANDYLITGDQKEREVFDRSASEAERLFREIPYEKVCKRCHPAAKGIVDRFYVIKGKELVEEMRYIKELSESFARIRSKGQEIFALDRPVGSAAGAKLMEEMDAFYHLETARIIMSYRGTIRGRVAEGIAAAQGVRSRSWLIMLLAAVSLASIGLIFSSFYARSFVLPIETIHERADTIARGDFKARVEVVSRDEIGQLAGAMNEMAEQLDSFYGTLERQVEERTRELAESEEHYRTMIETANDWIWTLDVEGNFTFINARAEEDSGYRFDEVKGKPYSHVVHPDDLEMRKAAFQKTLSGEPQQFTVRAYKKDGGIVILSVNSAPIYKTGMVMGTVNFGRDVTEIVKAREALLYERDKLIRVFEAMEDGVYIVNQNYDIEYINPFLEKEYGPWKGIKCYTYFHDRTEVCPWCPNQRVWAGETVRWEWYSFKNGKTYDLLDTPLRNPDGSVSKLEIFRDITDKKKAEEALKESETRLKGLVESVTDYVFTVEVKDGQPMKTTHGPGCVAITGYTFEEYEANPNLWLQMVYEGDRDAVVSQAEAVISGKAEPIEHRIICKDGRIKWVRNVPVPRYDENGRLISYDGLISDITERKKAEEALKQRLNELEEFRKVTIKRELRMEELQRKVEELERKLGKG